MTAPAIIQDLVNRFRDSRELYRSGRYNEAQLRQEFLNPLFEALGWDMDNRSNFAPQYRKVIHEDSLEDQGSVKAPDYAFRIGTTRKFFVEAKKPAVDIRYDIHPAYQLRRYAWNAHLPLSILSDFEELAVYDCRTRPDPGDSAATGRVMLFTFEEYLTRWDELAQTFSKDAVWNGSFDRYAEGSKGKRGTTEVDAEFLKEIEQWRLLLARNIALRNFRSSSNPVIASEAKQSQPASEAKQSQPASEAKQSQPASEAKQSQSASESKQSPNLHRAERQLNYAVQTTIDRILFLRICEDRKIEPTDQLLQIADGNDVYTRLMLLFQKADQKYNSGLFHFNEEKGQTSEPDTFTPTLQIDDKVLHEIIKSTYYPCPYMFNEIPVEILGQVYEQFLGSVIRLTPGGQAKVEEKPEVRKAGGVYYTPSYIVDYIVKNTLGCLLGDSAPVPEIVPDSTSPIVPASTPPLVPVSLRSTPPPKAGVGVPSTESDHQVSNSSPIVPVSRPSTETDREVSSPTSKEQLTPTQALNLRVVDPACGSGSFLLGAYQYLLDWHLNYYLSHDPQSHTRGKNPPLVATEGGEYRLTTETKKRILTSSIYGVDIDAQAVEVTKLSLLLKLLEGETGQLSLGFERVLPNLDQNIRCGNSLIGWDYFQGQMFPDEEELQRVNPFDWQRAFPHVFDAGGFDAVIGNPPYIRIQTMREWAPNEVLAYSKNYVSASKGNYDLYVVFIEKALHLLSQRGLLGFIVPNKFFNSKYGAAIRNIINAGKHIQEIVHFGHCQVFRKATTYTALLFLSSSPNTTFKFTKIEKIDEWLSKDMDNLGEYIPSFGAGFEEWTFAFGKERELLIKLNSLPLKLNSICDIFVGLQTSADDVYLLDYVSESKDSMILKSRALKKTIELERDLLHPILSGTDVVRYKTPERRQYILFPYFTNDISYELIDIRKIIADFPLTGNYLIQNRKLLENREKGKMKTKGWHGFVYHKNMLRQDKPKVFVPRLVESLHGSIDTNGDFFLDNVDVGGLVMKKEYDNLSLHYILALINSRLMRWYFPHVSATFRGGWFSANKQYLSKIPVVCLDLSKDNEYQTYNELVNLSKRMIELNKVSTYETPNDKEKQLRQIYFIDTVIDRLVYELYGLTDEEIKIVETNS